jgi:hypothetical protein
MSGIDIAKHSPRRRMRAIKVICDPKYHRHADQLRKLREQLLPLVELGKKAGVRREFTALILEVEGWAGAQIARDYRRKCGLPLAKRQAL